MTRDFRSELAGVRCWDRHTQDQYEAHGEPLDDCILQNREELLALCDFIESHAVRSYLEIGVWTGRLVSTLHDLFAFDVVAACDDGYVCRLGLTQSLPPETLFFEGDVASPEFTKWRVGLGHVDLVLLDADHHYHAVRRDFEASRRAPHRFIALHDIVGGDPHTKGVRRFWEELHGGHKLALVRPHLELGCDTSTMGIGIYWEDPT